MAFKKNQRNQRNQKRVAIFGDDENMIFRIGKKTIFGDDLIFITKKKISRDRKNISRNRDIERGRSEYAKYDANNIVLDNVMETESKRVVKCDVKSDKITSKCAVNIEKDYCVYEDKLVICLNRDTREGRKNRKRKAGKKAAEKQTKTNHGSDKIVKKRFRSCCRDFKARDNEY